MRAKSPEKDRSERYLLTYADLMNLLLILFIVLFCTSIQDVKKSSAVMAAIKEGFTGSSSTASSKATGTAAKGNKTSSSTPSDDYSDFFDQLIGLLKQHGISNKVDVTANSNEVIISLKDNVLFAPAKADLDTNAVGLLKSIGSLMTKIQYGQLIIEGHTDSDPIISGNFKDNRELSLMRAYNVSSIFQSCGLSPKKILPVGYGEYYPVAPNDTDANKAKNRRVVITILRKSVTPSDQSINASDLVNTLQNAAKGKMDTGKTTNKTSSSSNSSSSSASSSSSK